jgi:hypothetical protein
MKLEMPYPVEAMEELNLSLLAVVARLRMKLKSPLS